MLFRPEFLLEDIEGIDPAILFERITGINRKTYKSITKNQRGTRKSTKEKACDKFNIAFQDEFGINLGLQLEMSEDIESAPPWESYFNHPAFKNFYQQRLPETKKIVLFLEKKGLNLRSHLKQNEFKKAAECYSNMGLDKLKFESDILETCKKDMSLHAFLIHSLIFWLRILMYCMASLDAEIFGVPENKSQFQDLLPVMGNDKTISPIKNWFENLKKLSGCVTSDEVGKKIEDATCKGIRNETIINLEKQCGRKLSDKEKDDIDEDQEYREKIDKIGTKDFARQFRRWSNGEVKPKSSTLIQMLTSLIPERNAYQHYIFYRWAKYFNFIYYTLNEMLNRHHVYKGENKDIIEFFQDYNRYYEYFLEKYTAPVSQ